MDLMKITFSEQKGKLIEETAFKVREIEESIRIINIKTESIVTINDLEQFQKNLDNYVKQSEFVDFEKQIEESNQVYREEFDKMYEQFKNNKKEMQNMLTKNELLSRL